MKKTLVAALAIVAALVIVLAAARVALIQYQSPASNSGSLAIMGTDPPTTASGVSDATVAYSSVMAHASGNDMASGWTQVSGSGSMDLMASQSNAQVLANSQVNAATYDAFRFNVDSCKVVYKGQTYTSTVASSTITAQSRSAVQVSSGSSASAVVDMRTFIVNTASSSSPQFVFSASAVATAVPPQTSASLSLNVGSNVDLSSQVWFSTFVAQTSPSLQVSGTISSNSLLLSIQNTGSANGQVQEIIVTPVALTAFASTSLPASLDGSAIFTVSGSGTVQQTSSFQGSAFTNGGAMVASGSATTLTYNGNIATSSAVIVPGQQYIVTCIGANSYASTTVVAS
jgi:hypothetical protein